LENVGAIGPAGKTIGVYGDYREEVGRLLDALIVATEQQALIRPLVNPRLIFKLRDSIARSNESQGRILKMHELAASRTLPYIALLRDNARECYTATGLRLSDEWSKQWESDSYRTGCMATIFLNLPRLAYEARKDDERFFGSMTELLELVVEAFKIKKALFTERLKQPVLPLLYGSGQSTPYFHEKAATYAVAPLGLSEACLAHTGAELRRDSLAFGERVLQEMGKLTASASERSGMRLVVAQRPSDDAASRLAELDLEQYGSRIVSADGGRSYRYYTDLPGLPLTAKTPLEERLVVEGVLQSLTPGGHLAIISVDPNASAENLVNLTSRASRAKVRFLAHSRVYSFCRNCNQITIGMPPSCTSCASDNVTHYGRSSAIYLPLTLWPEGKRRAIERRAVYSLP
jgi:ribonucleoside-triphosphate reductase